jgi:anti-anti-sigma factor
MMDIFENRKNGWMIVEVKGRLDAMTAPLFREKIASLIDGGEKKLLLDGSGLEYISSAGIRVLFEAAYKIQDLSGMIRCCSLSGNIRKIFKLADISSEIPDFASQEEALKE